MLKKAAFAGAASFCFSFHTLFGGGQYFDDVDKEEYPKLGPHELPTCLSGIGGIMHISAIVLPIIGGTYAWTYFRARENNLKPFRSVAIRSTAAITTIILFDGLSWLYRLRVYGTKRKYVIKDDAPSMITRSKSRREVYWYRANQVVVPTLFTVGGHLTGLFPYIFIPILSWKSFWHFWVVYQTDGVLKDLGNDPMTAFRIMQQENGKEYAFERYCKYKHLEPTAEAERLYDCDLNINSS